MLAPRRRRVPIGRRRRAPSAVTVSTWWTVVWSLTCAGPLWAQPTHPPSPSAATAQTLDRASIVALAQQRAPEVVRALAEVQRAQARRVGAGRLSGQNPSLQLRAGPRVSSSSISPDGELMGWLPVPLLWDRWRALDAAEAGVTAQQRAVEAARLSAVSGALDQYARVLHAKASLTLANDRSDLAAALLHTTRTRAAAGDAAQLDVELAEAESAAAEAGVASAQTALEMATQHLALTLGMPGLEAEHLVGDLLELQQSVEAPAHPDALLAKVLSRHPALAAAQAAQARATAQRAEATTGWLPQVAVGAGYAFEEGTHTPSVGLRATLPLFERGQGARATTDADVALAEREAALQLQRLQTVVARAWRLHTHAQTAAEVLRTRALPHAEAALGLADRSYAAGKADINAVLAVRRTALALRAEHLARQLDAALAANQMSLLIDVANKASPSSGHEGEQP